MDSNHPRRLYESRVLPTELASPVLNLAGRAGFEPAHGVSNSHVPFQLGYRPRNIRKNQKAPIFGRSLREFESELRVLWTDQSRRPSAIDAPSHHGFGLYSHLRYQYSTISVSHSVLGYAFGRHQETCNLRVRIP